MRYDLLDLAAPDATEAAHALLADLADLMFALRLQSAATDEELLSALSTRLRALGWDPRDPMSLRQGELALAARALGGARAALGYGAEWPGLLHGVALAVHSAASPSLVACRAVAASCFLRGYPSDGAGDKFSVAAAFARSSLLAAYVQTPIPHLRIPASGRALPTPTQLASLCCLANEPADEEPPLLRDQVLASDALFALLEATLESFKNH